MSDFLKLLLSMSLSGSAIAIFLFAIKPFLGERFSKSWQYYIWLVVILRMLIPYSPEISLMGSLFNRVEAFQKNQELSLPARDMGVGRYEADNNMQNSKGSISAVQPQKETLQPFSINDAGNQFDFIFILWLSGTLLIFLFKVIQYRRYLHYLKGKSTIINDNGMWDLLQQVTETLRMKRKINLYKSELIKSPMLIGLLKPVIFLPENRLNQDNLESVFKHELIHLKRLDLWYKWLIQLTVCIHWFNPIVYIMRKKISILCELSCDEAVAMKLDIQGKMDYGNTLINAVAFGTGDRSNPISTTLCEDKKNLKERLAVIMKAGKKSRKIIILSSIITVILIGTAIGLGTFTKNSTFPKEPTSVTEQNGRMEIVQVNEWDIDKETIDGAMQQEFVSNSNEKQEGSRDTSSNTSIDKETIDMLLTKIMSSPLTSSNPGDYIDAHQSEYSEIITMGRTALPYLMEILDGVDTGLKGHIAKQIGEEITKELIDLKESSDEKLIKEALTSIDNWNIIMGYTASEVGKPLPEHSEKEVKSARAVVEEYFRAVAEKDAKAILATMYPREGFTMERVESGSLQLYGTETRTLISIDYDSQDRTRRNYRPINHPITAEDVIVFKVSFNIEYPLKDGGSWNEGIYDNWSMILFRDNEDSPWLIYDQGY